jgi:hypothetical protein
MFEGKTFRFNRFGCCDVYLIFVIYCLDAARVNGYNLAASASERHRLSIRKALFTTSDLAHDQHLLST